MQIYYKDFLNEVQAQDEIRNAAWVKNIEHRRKRKAKKDKIYRNEVLPFIQKEMLNAKNVETQTEDETKDEKKEEVMNEEKKQEQERETNPEIPTSEIKEKPVNDKEMKTNSYIAIFMALLLLLPIIGLLVGLIWSERFNDCHLDSKKRKKDIDVRLFNKKLSSNDIQQGDFPHLGNYFLPNGHELRFRVVFNQFPTIAEYFEIDESELILPAKYQKKHISCKSILFLTIINEDGSYFDVFGLWFFLRYIAYAIISKKIYLGLSYTTKQSKDVITTSYHKLTRFISNSYYDFKNYIASNPKAKAYFLVDCGMMFCLLTMVFVRLFGYFQTSLIIVLLGSLLLRELKDT